MTLAVVEAGKHLIDAAKPLAVLLCLFVQMADAYTARLQKSAEARLEAGRFLRLLRRWNPGKGTWVAIGVVCVAIALCRSHDVKFWHGVQALPRSES
jgi:hypothetical protein